MSDSDSTATIAAIATASGAAGISVVRVSGPEVAAVARALLGDLPKARQAHFSDFSDAVGNLIDQGLALYFQAPNSFTGEDVLELQGHGGEMVPALVLEAVCAAGARLAEPGEFAKRAFLNDKLDLAQAEAISDLIGSGSAAAARAAARSLTGVFSARVQTLEERMLQARAQLEAWLNFPDEPVDEVSRNDLAASTQTLVAELGELLAAAETGRRLRDGLNVLLIGPPNSGKSSLMNVLTGEETAIVTDLPGTTRDLLTANVRLGGVPVTVTDTAGLRAHAESPVEEIGMARARAALADADVVVWVTSDAKEGSEKHADCAELPTWLAAECGEGRQLLAVRNKIDLSGRAGGCVDGCYYISVLSGSGLDVLIPAVSAAGLGPADSGATGDFTARARHLEALGEARRWLTESVPHLKAEEGFVLVGEHLRLAHEALGRITGRTTNEDLLGEIFSQFCIGK